VDIRGQHHKKTIKTGTQPSTFCPVDGEGRKAALGTEVQKWRQAKQTDTEIRDR